MMQVWADQEEQERDRFTKHSNNYNNKWGNDHRNDRSQRDYSGSSKKRKPDDLVTAVERPTCTRSKKLGMTQEQVEKLLQKQRPWHCHTWF
jgi:hypothetical protein